jgi:hypothetical protein
MAVAADKKRPERLLQGRWMTCPRCRRSHDVLGYIPLSIIDEYRAETNPIYRCPSCRWIFSPALSMEELSLLIDPWEFKRREDQSDD